MYQTKFLKIAAAAVLSVGFASSANAQNRNLTIDDILAIKSVSNATISPDGKWIAYTVTTINEAENSRETNLWMVATDGGSPRQMSASGSSASDPAWSPDSQKLSFLSSRGEDAEDQVWALDLSGGEAMALTDVAQGVNAYEWSPTGDRLLLEITDKDPSAGDETPRPWVIDRLQFKADYQGYLNRLRDQLYVLDLNTKNMIQLTTGDWDIGEATWSPDGTRIAFSSNRTEEPDGNPNSDIWVVEAKEGASLLQVTTNPGSDDSPAWSPDGSALVYNTTINPDILWYETVKLAVIPSVGGNPRLIAEALDRNLHNAQFSGDGGSIYAILEDSGTETVVRIDVESERLTPVVSGSFVVLGYSLSDQDHFAGVISRPDLPGEVFTLKDDRTVQLTHTNQDLMADLHLASVREEQFNSADGTEIEGFFYFPPDYQEGKRYPTILQIHGGPTAQYDFSFSANAQLFAANGYVVVMTNPRGSTGYGEDFSAAIFADWGNLDSQDVLAGVDFAIAQGWADPERLGVGGWSYGGMLTDHILIRTDRFKAAVSGASEVLYIANYGHDHYQYYWEKELGLPWENPEAWHRISPFYQLHKVTTPTLLMGGEKDWNVPILNSEQMYQALKRLGVETQLVVYPGEGHGIRVPAFVRDRFQRYLDWYGRYLMPGQ